jgi:group I intron endonuclease
LEILEYCVIFNLIEREQYYISLFNPEYNILKIAGSNLGFKHSEATKELYRSSRLDHKRVNILKPYEEFTCYDNKKRVISEATWLNLSTNNYKPIPVVLINIDTGVIRKFPPNNKTAQLLGVSETTVRNFIKQHRICRGYII